MSENIARHGANPEFSRIVEPARLRQAGEFAFDFVPSADESVAIARLMGAQAIRKLRFHGRLVAAPGGAWRLEADLGATVAQTCVVTLEPVTTRIDTPVRRLFTPGFQRPTEIVIDDLDEDETEPLEDRIDLGLVAIEALALALPAYPRRSGVALANAASAPPGAAPLAGAEVRPFAALAALRGKLGEGS